MQAGALFTLLASSFVIELTDLWHRMTTNSLLRQWLWYGRVDVHWAYLDYTTLPSWEYGIIIYKVENLNKS